MVSQPIEGLEPDETPWGLARTSNGFLTLVGPATVARVDLEGHVTERVTLQRPQVNLFGLGETLLLQPASTTADEAVLRRVRLLAARANQSGHSDRCSTRPGLKPSREILSGVGQPRRTNCRAGSTRV